MQTENITDIIKKEFIVRCQRNESYSLRAYAKSLKVDHSLLAKILRGQRALSKKMAFQVGERLGLSSSEVQGMIEINGELYESQKISEDVFIVMADWYHFAILELVKTSRFSPDAKILARTLAITSTEAEMAIERLQRLGFISTQNGKVALTRPNNNWFDHKSTGDARKILQKQLLKKAVEAVDNVEFGKRINSSLTVAINPKDLPRLREMTQTFIDGVDEVTETSKNKKQDVYQLCVSFFPLTTEDHL